MMLILIYLVMYFVGNIHGEGDIRYNDDLAECASREGGSVEYC